MENHVRVSLCMIVRNEAHQLHACLDLVIPYVDEIIIVDTGSADNTVEVARELGARVSSFAWCDDFSAARNESLRQATGDWIFWLDADDRLDAGNVERLRSLLSSLDQQPRAYFMETAGASQGSLEQALVILHCRLFPRQPQIRWERRIHEQIAPSIERHGYPLVRSEVQIHHVGYQDPAIHQRKINRNLRLLRLEYAVDPTDAFTLLNMGLEYMALGQLHVALTQFLSALKHAPRQGDWRRRLYVSTSDILSRLNRHPEALAMTAEGLAHFPADAVLLTRRAYLLEQAGSLGEAEQCLLQLLRAPVDSQCLAGERAILDRRQPRYLLGRIYEEQGRFQEAERAFQELLAQHPTYVEGWVGLSYLYLSQKRFADAEFVARQVDKCEHGQIYAPIVRAERSMAQGDFPSAYALLNQAVAQAPNMVWARIVLGDWYLRSGADVAACVATQRDILRLDPGNVKAKQQLEHLLRMQGTAPNPSAFSFTI